MGRGPIQEREKKRRLQTEVLLPALAVFAVLVVLLWADARLYEKKEQNRLLQQELEQRQAELSELEQTQDLRQRAAELGLQEPDPSAVREVHVGREGP